MIGSLMWRPFDSRFQDLLKQLEFHDQLFRGEVALAHLHQTVTGQDAESAERLLADQERK